MKVTVKYFAAIREKTNRTSEDINTNKRSVLELYRKLNEQYNINIDENIIRFAINNDFVDANTILKENDTVVFISPISGG